MRIRALVPERSLYEYQIGETVYITYQNGNVSQRPFIGKIEKISQIPEQTEYTYDTYYTVYIIITENNHSLFYGMNVLVYLQNPYQDIPWVGTHEEENNWNVISSFTMEKGGSWLSGKRTALSSSLFQNRGRAVIVRRSPQSKCRFIKKNKVQFILE